MFASKEMQVKEGDFITKAQLLLARQNQMQDAVMQAWRKTLMSIELTLKDQVKALGLNPASEDFKKRARMVRSKDQKGRPRLSWWYGTPHDNGIELIRVTVTDAGFEVEQVPNGLPKSVQAQLKKDLEKRIQS